jgi:hypothetical protein
MATLLVSAAFHLHDQQPFIFLMTASLFLIAARSASAQKTLFLSRCSSIVKILSAFASTMI